MAPNWGAILRTLNQEPAYLSTVPGPATEDLDTDLLERYDVELAAIAAEWKAAGEKSGDLKAVRQKQNKFFRQRLEALNAATSPAIAKATANQGAHDHRRLAEGILARIAASPVAKVENVMTFDRTGQVGFCFGRAMYVHYLLLKGGVKPGDIARIFILGDLQVGQLMWKFHTAILVRDSKDGYLVIDPLRPKAMGYREWMKENAALEIKNPNSRARFYITDPRKFLPAYGKYDVVQVSNPLLKKYFDSLATEMK